MSKKVLIADDDHGIVDVISILLKMEGYQVYTTLDGTSVLGSLQPPPDIILLDILMSGVDGRDICRKLKAGPQTSAIPVILLSASKDVRHSALDAGADAFIEKPFEVDHLLATIHRLTHPKLA